MDNKNFLKIQSFLSRIPYINNGGCGIAALAMYMVAVKEKLNPKIHYLYHSYCLDNLFINEKYKRQETNQAASCGHVVIEIENKLYDSKGEYIFSNNDWIDGGLISKEHLIESIIKGSWNILFDRNLWLPTIEIFVGYKLL